MPNKTYELRNLYLQQGLGYVKEDKYCKPPLLQWPENGYFERFRQDSELFEKALDLQMPCLSGNVSEQIFGSEIKKQYTGLKHLAHLLYERAKLHKNHVTEINDSHIKIQEQKFGVEINNFPDRSKRLSNLEGQLLQLEQQRRDEELAFWKDTVELREKLFSGASQYSSAKQRYSVLSGMEGKYDNR